MELNEFADLTEEEFQLTYANLMVSDDSVREYARTVEEKNSLDQQDCNCKEENQIKEIELSKKVKTRREKVLQRQLVH